MKTFSLKYLFFSHKMFFLLSVWYIFLSNIFFFPQIIYFLSCNKDKNLTPYLETHIRFWWLYSCLGDWCNSVLKLHLTLIMMRWFFFWVNLNVNKVHREPDTKPATANQKEEDSYETTQEDADSKYNFLSPFSSHPSSSSSPFHLLLIPLLHFFFLSVFFSSRLFFTFLFLFFSFFFVFSSSPPCSSCAETVMLIETTLMVWNPKLQL